MSCVFFVVMPKRPDGKIIADMHLTDGKMYPDAASAQAAIDSDPATAADRHVVPMVAMTEREWYGLQAENDRLRDLAYVK